jgi:competence protein ComEC
MPRSGWCAIGSCLAAFAAGDGDPRAIGLLAVAVGAGLLAIPWLAPRRRTVVLAASIGMLLITMRAIVGPADPPLAGIPTGSGPWSMVVETVGTPRDGRQVATLRSAADAATGFRLSATLPRYPTVAPGDLIRVEGRPRARPDSSFGRYLERLGAWGTLDGRTLVLLERADDPMTWLEGRRRDAGEALARVLPEPEAGLAAGILIGLRDRVDRDVAAAFTTAGVSHVVAISGWNIAIVAAAVTALAGRLHRRRRALVSAIAIAAYIAFAGASPSVLRAGAMAGVVLVARESGRTGRAAAALGWAVVLLLLADPSLIGDAGFQLSTLATGGLIAWGTPLSARLDRASGGRLPSWLSESLGVSLAAQAATLPVVLASFGRLALIAPAVNLLVVPLVAPAMAAGLVALAGGIVVGLGAPTAIGAVLAAPGWVALRIVIGIVEATAAIPFASVALDPGAGSVLGASSGLAVIGWIAWRRRARSRAATPSAPADEPGVRRDRHPRTSASTRVATYGLVVAIAVAGGVAASRPAADPRVTVLDVGQGDAILIEGSGGGRLLVDGGPDPDRLLVELDRRIPPWDRRIDAIVLSHPHEDHVAGLAMLLARYRVGRVLEPGMRGPGPGYAAWLDVLGRSGAPARGAIAAGDRLAVDEIDLRVLWPVPGEVPTDPPDTGTGINNVSVVLLGTVGARRFLLAGDIEEAVDPQLRLADEPPVDLLKIAHHGSRTATTDAFVAAVRPRLAVASAGAGNPYGHPARATLDRLRAAGARVLRTDRDGTVAVTFGPAGMTVRTEPDEPEATSRVGRSVAAASVASVAARGGPRRSFLCGIPIRETEPGPDREPAPDSAVAPRTARTVAAPSVTGDRARLGYHRADDRPRPGGRRSPADLPRSAPLVPRAFVRRRRGRRVPREADPRSRGRRGSRRGRGGRPPARRRQDPPGRRSGAGPPARSGLGRLADGPGVRRARTSGRGPSRHASGRPGRDGSVGCLRRP